MTTSLFKNLIKYSIYVRENFETYASIQYDFSFLNISSQSSSSK